MLISAVFSFRNEEEVLEELVRRVTAALGQTGLEHELVFVDDDSSDRSLEILLRLREKDPRIKIVNMSRRFGTHPCKLAGLRYAKGDAVVYMDSDLQDPPELIPELVKKWRAGADVVNTVRDRRLGESAVKMWLTRRAYNLINLISDIDLPENMGDFKLLSRRVVDELLKLNDYDPYMRGLVRWVGFRQDAVFYTRQARAAGETHFSIFQSGPAKEFVRGITSFSAAPLYAAIFLGLLVSLLSFALIAYVLAVKFSGLSVPGWAGPMVAILFLGGIILFTNGILGMYVGRIYDQVKSRPLYIVRSLHGLEEAAGRR